MGGGNALSSGLLMVLSSDIVRLLTQPGDRTVSHRRFVWRSFSTAVAPLSPRTLAAHRSSFAFLTALLRSPRPALSSGAKGGGWRVHRANGIHRQHRGSYWAGGDRCGSQCDSTTCIAEAARLLHAAALLYRCSAACGRSALGGVSLHAAPPAFSTGAIAEATDIRLASAISGILAVVGVAFWMFVLPETLHHSVSAGAGGGARGGAGGGGKGGRPGRPQVEGAPAGEYSNQEAVGAQPCGILLSRPAPVVVVGSRSGGGGTGGLR